MSQLATMMSFGFTCGDVAMGFGAASTWPAPNTNVKTTRREVIVVFMAAMLSEADNLRKSQWRRASEAWRLYAEVAAQGRQVRPRRLCAVDDIERLGLGQVYLRGKPDKVSLAGIRPFAGNRHRLPSTRS